VVYDFCESRAGEHARTFLGEWWDSLVCDDYAGYVAAKDMLRQTGTRRSIHLSVESPVRT
jgi:hypothetical protein